MCQECLTFHACHIDHQEICFYLIPYRYIEDAFEKVKCDVIMNGLLPESCRFDAEKCCVNLASFNFSAYYMLQCPLINSSSAYHIDSQAQQPGPAEALESCESM